MITFSGDAVLLDIEGTTSSVTFVYDVMFPYVREHLANHIKAHWEQSRMEELCAQIASDGGFTSRDEMLGHRSAEERQARLIAEVLRQMDADMKVTGLKALQGDIWKDGFERGELRAHVYPEVVPNLQDWKATGCAIRIYSSGSIAAQQLFFGHSEAGNLLGLFDGHYDTTIGAKRSATSYAAIANDWGIPPERILFVSDVVDELNAAREAGLQTALCCRNELLASDHSTCRSFDEIHVEKKA